MRAAICNILLLFGSTGTRSNLEYLTSDRNINVTGCAPDAMSIKSSSTLGPLESRSRWSFGVFDVAEQRSKRSVSRKNHSRSVISKWCARQLRSTDAVGSPIDIASTSSDPKLTCSRERSLVRTINPETIHIPADGNPFLSASISSIFRAEDSMV